MTEKEKWHLGIKDLKDVIEKIVGKYTMDEILNCLANELMLYDNPVATSWAKKLSLMTFIEKDSMRKVLSKPEKEEKQTKDDVPF